MFNPTDIKQHMNVIAKDGTVIGIVDQLEGGTQSIKLTRDLDSRVHHWISLECVKKVDAKGVHLSEDGDAARQSLQSSPPAMAV